MATPVTSPATNAPTSRSIRATRTRVGRFTCFFIISVPVILSRKARCPAGGFATSRLPHGKDTEPSLSHALCDRICVVRTLAHREMVPTFTVGGTYVGAGEAQKPRSNIGNDLAPIQVYFPIEHRSPGRYTPAGNPIQTDETEAADRQAPCLSICLRSGCP